MNGTLHRFTSPRWRVGALLALLLAGALVVLVATTFSTSKAAPRRTSQVHDCGDAHGTRWRTAGATDDRWTIVATRRSDCSLGLHSLAALTASRSRTGAAVAGGPSGWSCYVSATSGTDGRPIAGVCRSGGSSGRFFAWRPPPPAAPKEKDDDS